MIPLPNQGTPPPAPTGTGLELASIGPAPLGGYAKPELDTSPVKPEMGNVAALRTGANVRDEIKRQAAAYNVPASVALAVAHVKSGTNQSKVTGRGAIGVFGLKQDRAQAMNLDPYNWKDNVRGGVQMLAQAYAHHGNWTKAVRELDVNASRVSTISRQIREGRDSGMGFTGNVRVAAPLPGNPDIGSGYGRRGFGDDKHFHPGVDIHAPEGTPLSAMVGGTVLHADHSNGAPGSAVVIRDVQGRKWAYFHLSPDSKLPEKGAKVKAGDPIGAVGHSGASAADRVYVQLQIGKTWVNPTSVIQRAFKVGKGTIQISDSDFVDGSDGSGMPADITRPSTNLPQDTTPAAVQNIPLPPGTPQPAPSAPIDARNDEAMTAMADQGPTSPELQNLQARQGIFSNPGPTV